MESWPRGLWRFPAKELGLLTSFGGSNPSLSAYIIWKFGRVG